MILLSICLVLMWVVFYFLTREMIRRNMQLQAMTSSEVMISSVEEELLALENAATDLGHNPDVISITSSPDLLSFYDAAGSFLRSYPALPANIRSGDNVILYNAGGTFYRLKGTISNTTLKRCFYLMENDNNRTLTVTSNNNTYIGSYETVYSGENKCGYVVLLMEQPRVERILNTFNDLDYLDVALFAGDRMLCSNKDIQPEDMDKIMSSAVFVREKAIGLSGYKLLVCCERSISETLSLYFRFALPITILILISVVAVFVSYLRRHMIEPIANVIAGTNKSGDTPLPYTGEPYFDSLVDHVNSMLARIEDREHELYESRMYVKEVELENERTLITLLKKQISAHFTVNTLNVVRALINKGEKSAAMQICDELSTLLRYANAGAEYISLLEEFYVLEQYIGIMQARYPDRIEAEIDEDDAFADIFIPRMLIQPVVENAIVHGLRGNKGCVHISADIGPDGVTVCVQDNGVGIPEDELEKLRNTIDSRDALESKNLEHIALQNIQRRIHMVCGDGYGISLESSCGTGTKVYLHLSGRKETK